ncbi:MAG: class I SAM-dependent methyltransferase [Bacteroidota bacterium]
MAKDYYHTKESVDEYIELAKDVNGRQLIVKLLTFLPASSSLLELGSGPGTDWGILDEHYQVTGSDNSAEFIGRLKIRHPGAEFLILNAVTLEIEKEFDGIYSNKVLHHLNDMELKDSIKRQYEVLNNNGIICHSFWKGEGTEVFKGLFVNYHTEHALVSFFEEYFEILLLERYAEFEDGDSVLLIGRKK